MFYQAMLNGDNYCRFINGYYEFPLHWHSEIEIMYCLNGSFEMDIKSTAYSVCKGQSVFIDSAAPHNYRASNASTQTLLIEIGPIFLKKEFQMIAELIFDRHIIDVSSAEIEPTEISSDLDRLFKVIIHELESPGSPGSEWIISGCLYELSALIIRRFPCHIDSSSQRKKKLEAIEHVNQALQYTREKFNSVITIENVAKLTGLGISNFCKQFKKATQMSFHQYLNVFRIEKACSLLFGTEDSIGDISKKVGFTETKTFCRVFRKLMHLSPTEYREKIIRK